MVVCLFIDANQRMLMNKDYGTIKNTSSQDNSAFASAEAQCFSTRLSLFFRAENVSAVTIQMFQLNHFVANKARSSLCPVGRDTRGH